MGHVHSWCLSQRRRATKAKNNSSHPFSCGCAYAYGGVASYLRRWTCKPEVPDSNHSPCHLMEFFWVVPNSAPPRVANSQLHGQASSSCDFQHVFVQFTTFVCALMSVSYISTAVVSTSTLEILFLFFNCFCHNFTLFVFAGNDLFLNSSVHDFLSALLRIYTSSSKLEQLDFNSPIPGLTSFYDL